jgi:hypothetical protein
MKNDINYVVGHESQYASRVSYEVDFDTFKEFVNKIFSTKFESLAAPVSEDQDSNLSPIILIFKKSKENEY